MLRERIPLGIEEVGEDEDLDDAIREGAEDDPVEATVAAAGASVEGGEAAPAVEADGRDEADSDRGDGLG